MKLPLLESIVEATNRKEEVALLVDLGSGHQVLLTDEQTGSAFGAEVMRQARDAMHQGVNRTIEQEGKQYFVKVFVPPLRLIVIGAVHIAQALAPIAQTAGYEVTIVDPRRAFASEERFPGQHVIAAWPNQALETLRPDRRTAIVTLTHDPKIDDVALVAALKTLAFYIGSLGSRRTHAKRLERLTEAGVGERDLAHINAPVGLNIGAVTPAEIALATAAQITEQLRRSGA